MRTPSSTGSMSTEVRQGERVGGHRFPVLVDRAHGDDEVGAVGVDVERRDLAPAHDAGQQLLGGAQGEHGPGGGHAGRQVDLQLDDRSDVLAGRVELDLQRLEQRIRGVGEDRDGCPGPAPRSGATSARCGPARASTARRDRCRRPPPRPGRRRTRRARCSAAAARSSAASCAAAACSASSRAGRGGLARPRPPRRGVLGRRRSGRLGRRRGQLARLLGGALLGGGRLRSLVTEPRHRHARRRRVRRTRHDAEHHRQQDHRIDPSDTGRRHRRHPPRSAVRMLGADLEVLDQRRDVG